MLDDQRGNLQVVAYTDESARLLELFELQKAEGPCLDCFATGQIIGNVNIAASRSQWPVFTVEQQGLSEEHVAVAQGMADVATIGRLHERALRDQVVLAEQLQTALHSRIVIEQAKGVLSARAGISVGRRSPACGPTPGAPVYS